MLSRSIPRLLTRPSQLRTTTTPPRHIFQHPTPTPLPTPKPTSTPKPTPTPTPLTSHPPHSINRRTLPQKFRLAGHEILGISIGAIETCIELPHYSLAIDIGRCPQSAIARRVICITHLHLDHVGGLGFHAATRHAANMEPPIYIVPPGTEGKIGEYLKMVTLVSGLDLTSSDYKICELKPGERFVLNKHAAIKPFGTSHTRESQGYVVYSVRYKLLERFKGLSGSVLRDLKEKGVVITKMVEEPEVAITGDTKINSLFYNEDVRKAKVLISELTFIDDEMTVRDARRRGHVHLDEVVRCANVFENNQEVLFTHFSARYTKDRIEGVVRKRLPTQLEKKTHLLSGADIPPLPPL